MNKAYLELKLAWQLHGRAPEALDEKERRKLQGIAHRQEKLESLILASTEAMCAIATPEAIAKQLAIIRERYISKDEMDRDLKRLGMDAELLEEAITRDLIIEYTLERVGSMVPVVSETDAEIYYLLHPESFTRPERRALRHILLTFRNAAEGEQAFALLNVLRKKLCSIEDFAAAALQHSHCPTALEGGKLGLVARGQLYQELENAAFQLATSQLSMPVCTEMGWHLLRCDEVESQGRIPFAEIRQELIKRMTERRGEKACRQWINRLGF